MSGVAAAIGIQALMSGVVVDVITMLGLVVNMEHLDRTRSLKLVCDFRTGESKFTKAQGYLNSTCF